LEAFKHSNIKDPTLTQEKLNRSPDEKTRGNEDSQTKVDVDEVFGFDEWEQNNEEENKEMNEADTKPENEKGVFDQNENDSDLQDLFEYKLEDIPEENKETSQEHTMEHNEIKEEEIEEPRTEKCDYETISQERVTIDEKSAFEDKAMRKPGFWREKYEAILNQKINQKESTLGDFKENKIVELKDLYKGPKIEDDEEIEPLEEKPRKLKVSLRPKTVKQERNGFVVKMLSNESEDIEINKHSNEPITNSQPVFSVYNRTKENSPIIQLQSSQALRKETKFNIYEYTGPEVKDTNEEISSGLISSESKMKEESNKEETSEKTPLMKTVQKTKSEKKEVSWFQRLVNDSSSQAIKLLPTSQIPQSSQTIQEEPIKKDISSQEMVTEIKMFKNSQENSQKVDSQSIVNENKVELPASTQEIEKQMNNLFGEMDFNDLDEEKLVNEMKDLDDPDNVDKVIFSLF